MDKSNIKQHVTFVGAIHIGFGALGVLGALILFFMFSFVVQFVEDEPIAVKILQILGNSLPLLILFFAAIDIIGGIGLFSYRPWARVLVLIISAINCLNVPIGTAKGVYSIWVLMHRDAIELFDGKKAETGAR
ncbi:MAG: hypothetical protein JXR52_03205 [Bacteroidales bacterium]|nr:hypothetical protein [Bacteroidales bacterium]MBN2697804.1 hypothetical protein [Bacteroidales bacterium]